MKSEGLAARLRNKDAIDEIQAITRVMAHKMSIPLFMTFWFLDLLVIPEDKWICLAVRSAVIPISVFVTWKIKKIKSYFAAQMWLSAYVFCLAAIINTLILISPKTMNIYYVGLNLVCVGTLSFVPFQRRFYFFVMALIYVPFFVMSGSRLIDAQSYTNLGVNSFFIIGSLIICFIIRFFNERLRVKEINARLLLADEIHSREAIINLKTEENVKITQLSAQFSPQVIQSIQSNVLDLDKPVHREKICAIFIDIVGSTERVVRLDPAKMDMVLARFMDTCFSVLLKHDLTIDKFQGDGILAFSNNPIPHDDFMERACLAALEVKKELAVDRDFYLLNWEKALQIRVGIASGLANVGFYGNRKYFKTYTAIGVPLSLAARLTAIAQPDQLVVNSEVAQRCQASSFQFREIGPVSTLKGFEGESIVIHALESHPSIAG